MSARVVLAGACLALAGCRTAGKAVGAAYKVTAGTVKVATGTAVVATKVAAKTAVGTVKVAAAIVKDFDYYARKAVALRKFHDSAALPSKEVAAVLGRARGKRRKYPPLPAYAGSYRWPLGAGVVSSEFGRRWGKNHEGIDIAADPGEPVFASAAGRVEYAGSGLRGYGNAVILRHDEKTTTLYAHNSALKVREGQRVASGAVIALLGSTGHSTGPHVHFEIRSDRTPVDPRSRLPRSRF